MESCPNVSRRSSDWKEITGKKNLLEEGHWKEQEVEKVSSGKSRPVEEVSSGRQLRVDWKKDWTWKNDWKERR